MNQPSILVVDDQPRNFDVLESLLSSQNYELHYASSGQEALESLELIPLDLILLDVMMPEMDGIEVCSRIKANPQWQSIPIIMVTALTEKEDLALCLSAGADDFLSKPVNGLELRARVHSMLRIKQQYDNLQTLLKLREDLVKMLVHDLRNPLAGILLGLEMLTYPKLSPEAKQEKIVKIKLSGQKLSGLIDDLLLMARIESGKIALNLSPVDLGNMLRKLVKDFEFNASQKKIEIITQIPDFDGTIKIDQAMCQRVLDNLLSNSIKFSPQESQIIVIAEHLPEGGTKIKIADYGQGVPDNLKQCIFEKYEIGTLMQGVSQIGLGLAFCKMIVEDKQQQAIETIATSGTHLLSLINDILDIAKIESGKFEIECAPTSIQHLCESSLLFIKQQSLQKRITIQTKIPPKLPEIIVDERRLRQVLINLLDNAIKFTPAGGKITFDVTIENSSSIGFAVTDTGIGITPENLAKLFQPFIQIDSALNRQYAGTGLGLTLVKRIVEMHGGEVKVESTIDLGSCFAFRLPCQDLLLKSPQSPSENGLNLDPSSTNQALQELSVILLAEDHEANIITISRYLKAKGYQIILAGNGQEAIDQAKLHDPDLILMDIQMPVMDGLEAIQRIREDSDRKLANIPIIALTALAMTSDKQKCLEAGANDYLTKPVKLSQLTSTIQQILAQGKN